MIYFNNYVEELKNCLEKSKTQYMNMYTTKGQYTENVCLQRWNNDKLDDFYLKQALTYSLTIVKLMKFNFEQWDTVEDQFYKNLNEIEYKLLNGVFNKPSQFYESILKTVILFRAKSKIYDTVAEFVETTIENNFNKNSYLER